MYYIYYYIMILLHIILYTIIPTDGRDANPSEKWIRLIPQTNNKNEMNF